MKTEFTVTFDNTEYPCFFIDTKERAEEVIEVLKSKKGILAADTETAGAPEWRHLPKAALSPHLASPRLLQLFTGTGAVIIDLWATGPIDLKSLFENRPSVFHNMTFDYKMLRQHYDVVDPDMHCTCIMARCVFHAIYAEDKKADLQSVTYELFGEQINKKAGRSDWSIEELTFEQIQYAAVDAIVQMRIYEKLSSYIDQLNLRKVYDLYRKAQIVLCEMELNGITFDVESHKHNVVKWRMELLDAQDAVKEMTGMDAITGDKLGVWLEQNLSPANLTIWPRTDTGKLSTDANTFVQFSHIPIAAVFAKYQKLKKLTTSFGMNLLSMLNPATGKLHPNYRVAGAKTGRLSCAEPNIQQSPRSSEFRSTFTASPGYVMVVADYGSVEVRHIAEMSQDEKMLEAYESGLDLYSYTASQLTGIPYEKIGKKSKERQQAKALVLGLNYGLGHKKFTMYAKKGYEVNITEEESAELVAAYRKLYPQLRDWQLRQIDMCPGRMYTAFSYLGKSRKMTEDNFYCACINHVIQAGCAEIMLLALVKTRNAVKGTSARLLASVHDEIILECKPEDLKKVMKLLEESMTEAYAELVPNARTLHKLVEASSGPNWAEAKT